jgi:large subunit ribosomal protein L17
MNAVWIAVLFPSSLNQSAQGENPITTAGWLLIILALIAMILLAWWVIRSNRKEAPPAAPPDYSPTVHTAAAPTPEPAVRSIEAPVPAAPDDLIIIEGIGPKIAGVLQDAGILTFRQLAALQPEQIKELLDRGGVRLADPRSWPEQARLAADGDMDGLKALQDRLTAGRTS